MSSNLLQVSDMQMNKIYRILDELLKRDGLGALQDVVEVYNALITAVKLPDSEAMTKSEEVPLSTEEKKINE